MSELEILSVNFSNGPMEITYVEERENLAESVGMVRTLVIGPELYEDSIETIMDELKDLIDRGLLAIRNPPSSINPRKRLNKGQLDQDDE